MYINQPRSLSYSAVLSTPLDGTTAGRTLQPSDRNTSYSLDLSKRCDTVTINAIITGSNTNTVAFRIYLYAENGPAMATYYGTAAAGTFVAGTGKLYAESFTANSITTPFTTVTLLDSGVGRIATIKFDALGVKYIVIEPITFTTATAVEFLVREYGSV